MGRLVSVAVVAGVLVAVFVGCVRPAGGIVVETRPAGASVYLQGLEPRTSPARFAPVPSGTYELVIERASHGPVTTTVTVEPNVVSTLSFELEPTNLRGLAREPRFAINVDGRLGFIDAEGRIRIEPRYAEARPFSEGLAAVAEEGAAGRERQNGDLTYSYIDVSGEVVIEGPLAQAESFSEGLAFVRGEAGSAYINHAGETILAGDWIEGSRFYRGYAGVRHADGGFSLIRRSGERVDPAFDDVEAEEFVPGGSEGIALIRDRDGRGRFLRLREGAPPLDVFCRTFFRAGPFSEGLALVVDDNGARYIDEAGGVVIEPPGYDHRGFSDGLARFRDAETGLIGYIDTSGRTAISPSYPLGASFSQGRAAFSPADKWGYINRRGDVVIEPRWDGVLPFRDGLARVFVGATEEEYVTSYIDMDGTTVWRHGPGDRLGGGLGAGDKAPGVSGRDANGGAE